MMFYAGFDYGNKFGHACHDGTTIVLAGLLDLDMCKTKGAKALRLYNFLCGIPQYCHADAFSHEHILMVKLPHIRPATTANQASLDMIVQMVYHESAKCYPCQGKQLKKFVTGSAKATKEDMLDWARREYPAIHVDNEHTADAMGLARHAAAKHNEWRMTV